MRIPRKNYPLGKNTAVERDRYLFGIDRFGTGSHRSVTEEMEMAENEDVIKQNSIGETVYLIINGQVSVIMEKEDGSQAEIDQMDSGAAFGEMALIDNSPRSATIRTITPSRFLILHKQEFKETAMEFPRIALQICSVLSQRIRHLHSLVQNKKS